MAMRYYISTEEASFFVNNSMGYANSIPTTGNYKVGDFIISSTQEDGIFGWVCTVAGTPGEWEVIGSGMSGGGVAGATRVVGYYNTVEFSDARTSVEIGIEGFDNNKDFLEVHYNGLLLAKDVHYTVSDDGLSINAIGEVWNENADDTQSMTFRVLKSEGMKVKKLSNIVDIDTSCYDVEIGISGYSSSDILEVHLNGVLLVEGLDYTVENGRLIKVDRSEAWNPYNVAGQKMYIDVFKNIGVVIEPEDGSVTMEKLAPEVAEELEAIDGILDTLSMQTNSLSNLNNRVSELENDNVGARVGDLSYLNTEDKTDLVAAINEVNVYAQQSVGDIDNLQTTLKGNLVEAINELFINANNGKELIASAIGEPLSSNDTFSAMSNEINGLLSTFKTNMMNNGVVVESGDRFKSLIDKIATLADNEGNKVSFATGFINTTANLVDEYTTWNWIKNSFTFDSSLDFTPTRIILSFPMLGLSQSISDTYYLDNYTVDSQMCYDENNVFHAYESNCNSSISLYITNISNTGFDLYATKYTENYPLACPEGIDWLAIGVGEEDTTLRDSLADILENKGVDVTEEDDMASLITKVDEEFDNKDIISNVYDTLTTPLKGYDDNEYTDITITHNLGIVPSNINIYIPYEDIYDVDGTSIGSDIDNGFICDSRLHYDTDHLLVHTRSSNWGLYAYITNITSNSFTFMVAGRRGDSKNYYTTLRKFYWQVIR